MVIILHECGHFLYEEIYWLGKVSVPFNYILLMAI